MPCRDESDSLNEEVRYKSFGQKLQIFAILKIVSLFVFTLLEAIYLRFDRAAFWSVWVVNPSPLFGCLLLAPFGGRSWKPRLTVRFPPPPPLGACACCVGTVWWAFLEATVNREISATHLYFWLLFSTFLTQRRRIRAGVAVYRHWNV